jgi:hypothetical protein
VTKRNVATLLSALYVATIAILFAAGAGVLAAYFTLPASWLVIGVLPELAGPGTWIDAALSSWIGNLLLVVASAAVNVAGLYALARFASR